MEVGLNSLICTSKLVREPTPRTWSNTHWRNNRIRVSAWELTLEIGSRTVSCGFKSF